MPYTVGKAGTNRTKAKEIFYQRYLGTKAIKLFIEVPSLIAGSWTRLFLPII
ncbi:hypothetical protein SAMN05216389_108153 [Oceanobacillus limi]|uniref:Uncharacterized protein n=1 Tax=Oceanobacillus limi TaxID=930131 RepID=A0A1I0DFG3_9BACI|nr:hypothetical protein [Oceanobacillus limi]SET30508.1 hypothetical protein SAMN05216389_108153 [Oceanobacillus limi]